MNKISMPQYIPRDIQKNIFYFKYKIEQEEEQKRKTKELKRRLNLHIITMRDTFNEWYLLDQSDTESDTDDEEEDYNIVYLNNLTLNCFKKRYNHEYKECRTRIYNKHFECFLPHNMGELLVMPHYTTSNEPL